MGTFQDGSIEFPLIEESLVQPGYIERVEGLHSAVRFKFKPMLPEEVDSIEWKMSNLPPDKARRLAAEQLAKQVKWWDIRKGESPVDITEAATRRLRPALFVKMWSIVRGMLANDVDPDWVRADGDGERSAEEITAPSGLTLLGADVKN